jgi:hypothetical protein
MRCHSLNNHNDNINTEIITKKNIIMIKGTAQDGQQLNDWMATKSSHGMPQEVNMGLSVIVPNRMHYKLQCYPKLHLL